MTSDTPDALRLAECLDDALYCTYAQMKASAIEMRRLHSLNVEMLHLLKCSVEMLRMGSFPTGYCCCGSAVESHGMGDGHSPVDAGDYVAQRTIITIEALLARIEPPQQIVNGKAQQNDL